MRASISLPLVWLLLCCAAPDDEARRPSDVATVRAQPPLADVAAQPRPTEAVPKKRAQKAGRSHDLRRAAMVDIVTRRLAVDP